ncbi:MAG: cytochrome P460 family protein [Burkholderiales bacterium]|nr:cytochrome P460 family protein [Burkholderiales bacterium]
MQSRFGGSGARRAGLLAAALPLLLAPALARAQGADAAAGRAKVEAACAACHGANGVSVADNIPNLAGQKAAYLENQLRALKSGARRNAVMGAVAAQLSPQDIANVAAYFASLPGASMAGAKSALLPGLAKTSVTLPADHRKTFIMYQTVNRPDINQVRYLYANDVALRAAREGRPLPDGSHLVLEQHAARLDADRKPIVGPDGFFVADRLVNYAVMERGAGWGRDIPENIRNEDWQYAVYAPTRELRTTVNQAECLACHKPLDKDSFTFSIKALTEAAKKR